VRFLLYGANGYTGRLIADVAKGRGLAPVLAGRREEAVRPIAERLGLEWRAFALDDRGALDRAVAELKTVLLAAGPFSHTSRPVVDAVLAAGKGAAYLDITGEVEVFEAVLERDAEARERGAVLLPGVGFDVVPTDSLAVALKTALPSATRLELAIAAIGSPSRGTARTSLERLPRGGAVRQGGRLVPEPFAARVRTIPFRDRPRVAASIPWGDLATAYRSTGIPDIVVYAVIGRRAARLLPWVRPLLPLAGLAPVQRGLGWLVDRTARGPEEAEVRSGRSQVWGRVSDARGRAVEGTATTPEGYRHTADASVECARRVGGGAVAPGAWTPALAFGWRFLRELEDCDLDVPGLDGVGDGGPVASRAATPGK